MFLAFITFCIQSCWKICFLYNLNFFSGWVQDQRLIYLSFVGPSFFASRAPWELVMTWWIPITFYWPVQILCSLMSRMLIGKVCWRRNSKVKISYCWLLISQGMLRYTFQRAFFWNCRIRWYGWNSWLSHNWIRSCMHYQRSLWSVWWNICWSKNYQGILAEAKNQEYDWTRRKFVYNKYISLVF